MSTSVPPPGFESPPGYGLAPPEPEPAALPELPTTPQPPLAAPPRGPRRFANRSRLLAGGIVLVGAVAAAFVLLGSTNTPVSDPIAQAATLSSSAPGYRMNYAMSITGPNLPAPVTGNGSAIVDLRDHSASVSFAIDFSQEPQVAQLLGSTTMDMRMILDQGALYMNLPSALLRSVPGFGGKRWLKIDISKLTGVPGLGSLGNDPSMGDPSRVLEYLRANSTSITDEGPEQVNGIATTHYRAMLDLTSLAANLPSSEQAQIQQALSQLERTAGTQVVPVDVWIDAHHLVRRVALALSISTANGGTVAMNETADLTDYGPQPQPALPPADQVQDLANLIHIGG